MKLHWTQRHPEENRARASRWYYANKEYALDRNVRYRQKMLDQFYVRFGSECLCCGETNRIFLTVDHVNNNGAVKRRELSKDSTVPFAHRHVSTHRILYDLKRRGWPLDDLQVLCMNCNFAKRRVGYCPHGTAQTAQA